jgi:hypothetical protein
MNVLTLIKRAWWKIAYNTTFSLKKWEGMVLRSAVDVLPNRDVALRQIDRIDQIQRFQRNKLIYYYVSNCDDCLIDPANANHCLAKISMHSLDYTSKAYVFISHGKLSMMQCRRILTDEIKIESVVLHPKTYSKIDKALHRLRHGHNPP